MQIPHMTLSNGVRMPMVGLGTWDLRGERCTSAVRTALDLGYRHIDTAVAYDNHKDIAKGIAGFPREQLFLTTKIWHSDLDYEGVLRTCQMALDDLGTEYVDLLLIHWPNKAIPMEETFRALGELVDQGKVRAIGASNFTAAHLEQAEEASDVPVAVNQVEFHPYLYQQELLLYCLKNSIHLTAYSPLAKGRVRDDPLIAEIAKKHGKTPGQVTLRWLLDKHISVIPKASSREHLQENLALDFKLTKDDIALLDSLPQQRIVNPGWSEF